MASATALKCAGKQQMNNKSAFLATYDEAKANVIACPFGLTGTANGREGEVHGTLCARTTANGA